MNKLMIAAAVAGALALPGLANAADVTGAWKLAVTFNDQTFHTNCDFKQAGAALTGTCTPADAPPGGGGDPPKPAPVTGSVDGSNVKFAYDISFGDMPIHLDYVGVLDSDTSMKGNIGAGDMQIPFTATKG